MARRIAGEQAEGLGAEGVVGNSGLRRRGAAARVLLGPQRLVLGDDHRPVEHRPGARTGLFAKTPSQIGVEHQDRDRRDRLGIVDRRELRRGPHIVGVVYPVVGEPGGKVAPEARAGRGGGDAKAVLAVAHGVLVAVPVGDDARQAGGHRLDRRQAIGLLDIVGKADEEVGDRPDRIADVRLAAIDVQVDHRGTERAGLGVERHFLRLRLGPAGIHPIDGPAGGDRGFFQRQRHQRRVHLCADIEAADIERDRGVGGNPQPLAPGRPAFRRHRELLGIDPERDGDALQFLAPARAKFLIEVLAHLVQLRLDARPHSRGGADQGVVVLKRRHQQIGDRPHDLFRSRRMGNATDGVGARAHCAAVPDLAVDFGGWHVEDADRTEPGPVEAANPADRLVGLA